MNRTYHRTADGQQVSEGEAFDERGQLRDGFTMRTKLTLIDGVPVVAPAAGLTDEQRYDLVDQYNERISNAWRNPPPVVDIVAGTRMQDGALTAVAAVAAATADPYEKYDARIQDAWRS
jgi:hypothetical protein